MLRKSFRYVSVVLLTGLCLSSPLRLASAGNGAEGLNRLFTDPETRARMDAARKGDPVLENIGEYQSAKKIRVDGVMMRENGDNVVWVNGESSLDNNKIDGARVRTKQIDRKNYRVPLRLDDKTVRLKPGQAWTDESGKVSDDY